MSAATSNQQVGTSDQSGSSSNGTDSTNVRKRHTNTIENAKEFVYFSDERNRYVVKVCNINGVTKVGFTRFYKPKGTDKFIPGSWCYMPFVAYQAFMSMTQHHELIAKHGLKLQRTSMFHTL